MHNFIYFPWTSQNVTVFLKLNLTFIFWQISVDGFYLGFMTLQPFFGAGSPPDVGEGCDKKKRSWFHIPPMTGFAGSLPSESEAFSSSSSSSFDVDKWTSWPLVSFFFSLITSGLLWVGESKKKISEHKVKGKNTEKPRCTLLQYQLFLLYVTT